MRKYLLTCQKLLDLYDARKLTTRQFADGLERARKRVLADTASRIKVRERK